ncbi:MAG: LCP family protein [Clostridia bacterium]|nr:LCP family protein [Clostridia bacterium]
MKKQEQLTKKEKKQNKKIEKKKRKQEKKEKRKKSKAWKAFKIIMIILLITILAFAGIFTYKMAKNGWGLQGFIATAVGHDEYTLKDLNPINFLLIGISGYEEDYKLADTIMVCSYNPKTQKASILSIPRDTYVGKNKEKASASYKINAVYRNGENINGMVKSIEGITGLEISNYFIIDTDALVELVDAIGGVTFDVPIDMKYDDEGQDLHIDLKAGVQKLDGKQAEGLVRFRHNNDGSTYSLEYGDNDVGRMKTQREFITELMKQTLKPENIFKLTKIAEIAFKNITTNMTWDSIKDYIPYAVSFNTENLKTGVLPGTPELCNKVWIYTVNKKQTKTLIEELFSEEEETIPEENTNTIGNTVSNETASSTNKSEITIELLNGSGKAENLSKVTKLLKQKGYNVIKTGNTTTTDKTSITNKTNQPTVTSNNLKEILKVGTITKKSDNSKVDYTIIIGKDYK